MASKAGRDLSREVSLLLFLLGLVAAGPAFAGSAVIGSVAGSRNATIGGQALLANTIIVSGDTLEVNDGAAVVALDETSRMVFGGQTTVSFLRDASEVTVLLSHGSVSVYHPQEGVPLRIKVGELSVAPAEGFKQIFSGTLVVGTDGEHARVVETPGYKINPTKQGKAVYVVTTLPDKSTLVAARSGQVSITEISSNQSYLLSQGQYVQIPALSSGVPRQGAGKVEAARSAPGTLDPSQWHIGSLSPRASIILVTAIAAGTAAAIAIPLATGGGPVSPSAP